MFAFQSYSKVLLTDKPSWNSKLQLILFCKQGHNTGEDGTASEFALTVFGHKTWSNFNFHTNLLNHKASVTD